MTGPVAVAVTGATLRRGRRRPAACDAAGTRHDTPRASPRRHAAGVDASAQPAGQTPGTAHGGRNLQRKSQKTKVKTDNHGYAMGMEVRLKKLIYSVSLLSIRVTPYYEPVRVSWGRKGSVRVS